ncbi:MAG: hypothetical protein JSV81_18560 [Anaerolineales bacterium]|nr:MAG: hypothetical protein JSV81_18560 [Anaerolineales bacterium]
MWKTKLVLITFLFALYSTPMSLVRAAPLPPNDVVGHLRLDDSTSRLWLDIGLGPPLVNWFNRVARPDDIARVNHAEQIGLLDEITVGRKLVVFKSAAEAERLLPQMADKMDILGYNLEHEPAIPFEEQADPVGSVKRMHDLARQYGLTLALGPDHSFALSDGVEMAPYVDIFVIQVQRAQTEPAKVLDFALPLIRQLRQANPSLQISVQVRTEGDVVAIADLIDCLRDDLDGVSILTSPETVDIAETLVAELRTRTSSGACQAATWATAAPQVTAMERPNSTREVGLSCPLKVVSALIAGGVGGGLTAALICASRNKSTGG